MKLFQNEYTRREYSTEVKENCLKMCMLTLWGLEQ